MRNVVWEDVLTFRCGDQVVGGLGPDYLPYNEMLDQFCKVVPGVKRELVVCDGLIGSALVRCVEDA